MKMASLLVAGVLVTALLVGCQSYRDGRSRTVGELTDDTAIQAKVKSRLIGARDVKGLLMNVEVKKGVVTLYGRTKSQAMSDRAVAIAKSVKGVTAVEDRTTVEAGE